jgi:Helicase associated domain
LRFSLFQLVAPFFLVKIVSPHLNTSLVLSSWVLSAWVAKKQKNYRIKRSSDDKEQRLLDLGFVFDTYDPSLKFISSGHPHIKHDLDTVFQELTSRMENVNSYPTHRQAAPSVMSKVRALSITEPTDTIEGSRKRKAEDDSEMEVTSKQQARSESQPKSRKKVALKNGLPQSWGDVSKIRMLKPIADSADFDVMGEQVRVEFAELCQPDEPQDEPATFWITKANRRFEAGFVDFLAFQMIYGHAIVPKHFPERPTLGRWVQEVRQWKSSSNKDRLTPSRLRRLSEAGFVWNAAAHPDFRIVMGTAQQCDELWEERFHMLLEYKAKNGHCNVPKEDRYEKAPSVRSPAVDCTSCSSDWSCP